MPNEFTDEETLKFKLQCELEITNQTEDLKLTDHNIAIIIDRITPIINGVEPEQSATLEEIQYEIEQIKSSVDHLRFKMEDGSPEEIQKALDDLFEEVQEMKSEFTSYTIAARATRGKQ